MEGLPSRGTRRYAAKLQAHALFDRRFRRTLLRGGASDGFPLDWRVRSRRKDLSSDFALDARQGKAEPRDRPSTGESFVTEAKQRVNTRAIVASFVFTDLVAFSKGTASEQYA